MKTSQSDNIIIVGGGAGGLELACKLGRKLGRERVTLVDHAFYHIWKPSLHEVAAGTMDMHKEGLPYTMLAHHNDFTFVYGSFAGLDAEKREITVAAVEEDAGDVIIPQRRLGYAKLCIAVGSTSHYFNTPGAAEHTISLNGPGDAERFRIEMLKQMTWAENRKEQDAGAGVDVIIIGGGATGVELAAELREASNKYIDYGFRRLDATRDIRITLLEGAPRILPPLPEKVAAAAKGLLEERHVRVVAGCRVAQIVPGQVQDATGHVYPYHVCVWAAGIKAPAFLATLGLPTNAAGQLEVTPSLNVKGHADIYAIGDCAACTMEDGRRVPPRAQAAHQQADHLYRAFVREMRGGRAAPVPYVYRDYGSLVSVGSQTSVGTLMGSLKGRSWFVRGGLARIMYVSLHLLHDRAVLGWMRTCSLAIARTLIRRNTALVKLH
jgi:NADH dehydrogenase